MTCYSPSRHFLTAALVVVGLAIFSSWVATQWTPGYIFTILLSAAAILLFVLAFQPAIELYEHHLAIGKKVIPWSDVERLDRTSWISPLIVHLTLTGDRRVLLVYPGDIESGKTLLRHLRRCASDSLIDGIPYRQFWGEVIPSASRRQLPSPKYPLLRAEDEAEVERMFQRLKTVGHLDPKSSVDEK